MTSGEVKFALRIPAQLHSELRATAQHERRSVNAQILTLVEEALTNRKAREPQQADNSATSKKPEHNAHQATNIPQQLSIEDFAGLDTDHLTPNQKYLLTLLLEENLSYRELSRILNINASTVRDRTSTILRRLGLTSRAELLDKYKHSKQSGILTGIEQP